MSIDCNSVGGSSRSISQTIYFAACAQPHQLAAEECLKSLISLRESAAGEENDLFSELSDSTKNLMLRFVKEENRFSTFKEFFLFVCLNSSEVLGWFQAAQFKEIVQLFFCHVPKFLGKCAGHNLSTWAFLSCLISKQQPLYPFMVIRIKSILTYPFNSSSSIRGQKYYLLINKARDWLQYYGQV